MVIGIISGMTVKALLFTKKGKNKNVDF